MTRDQMLNMLTYMEAEIQAMIKLIKLDKELDAGTEAPKESAKHKTRAAKKPSETEILREEFNDICKKLPAEGQKKAVRIIREVNLEAKGVKDLTVEQLKEILPDIRALKEDYV